MSDQTQTEDRCTIKGARTLPVDELGHVVAAATAADEYHPEDEGHVDRPQDQDVTGQLRTIAAGAALTAIIGARQPARIHRAVLAGADADQVRAALGGGRLAVAELWRVWADSRRDSMSGTEYEQVGRVLYTAVWPDLAESPAGVRCPWCHRSADIDMMSAVTRYECPEDGWSWTPDVGQPYSLLAEEFLDTIDPYEREGEGLR